VLFVNIAGGKPANVLMGGVITSAIVSAVPLLAGYALSVSDRRGDRGAMRSPTQLYWASIVGIVMTAVRRGDHELLHVDALSGPCKKLPVPQETGHATNIIAGLAVGQHAYRRCR
jgi:K(+)-stimulated pyrophosphate-energized sodium pump